MSQQEQPISRKRREKGELIAESQAKVQLHEQRRIQAEARLRRLEMTKEDKQTERTHKLCVLAGQLLKLADAKDKHAPLIAQQIVFLIDTLDQETDKASLADWRAKYAKISKDVEKAASAPTPPRHSS